MKKIKAVKISKSLEKATKAAQVQVLQEGGASHREIAMMLRMSTATVWNYLKFNDKNLKDIKAVIKRKQMFEDYHVADKARQRIEANMDKASFRDTVGAWKIARDLQTPRFGSSSTGTAIQININSQSGNVSIEDTEGSTTPDV